MALIVYNIEGMLVFHCCCISTEHISKTINLKRKGGGGVATRYKMGIPLPSSSVLLEVHNSSGSNHLISTLSIVDPEEVKTRT
jgi:hypothetical protein